MEAREVGTVWLDCGDEPDALGPAQWHDPYAYFKDVLERLLRNRQVASKSAAALIAARSRDHLIFHAVVKTGSPRAYVAHPLHTLRDAGPRRSD